MWLLFWTVDCWVIEHCNILIDELARDHAHHCNEQNSEEALLENKAGEVNILLLYSLQCSISNHAEGD